MLPPARLTSKSLTSPPVIQTQMAWVSSWPKTYSRSGRGSPSDQMLPKNQSDQSTAPSAKNQNSSVTQKACSTVTREKAPKNVSVSNPATGSRKSAMMAVSHQYGMTRGAGAGGAPSNA